VFLANRTAADFQEWRDQRDWTARKYAMWEAGEQLPAQRPNSHDAMHLWRVVRQMRA
jgi:hypothetical protein